MDDKDIYSTPEDKSLTDTVEDLFDDLFASKKTDEPSVPSKKRSIQDTPPSKSNQQKITPGKPVNKGITPAKTLNTNKKKLTPDTPSVKTVQKRISPEKPVIKKSTPSLQTPGNKPVITNVKSIKDEVQTSEDVSKAAIQAGAQKRPQMFSKTNIWEKVKKGTNPLIFTILIILVVILSIFIGKIIDLEGIPLFSQKQVSIPAVSKPFSIKKTAVVKNSVSKEIVAPSLKENLLESEEIQGQDDILKEEENEINSVAIVLEKNADTPTDVTAIKFISYPYSIYLGSYNSITSVKELSSDYTKKGVTSFWIKKDLGEKGIWYRLFAGCFQTRQEADQFIKDWKMQDAESRLTKYANLIGAFNSKEAMDKQKARLEEMGNSVYSISDAENKYRLYTGAFYKQEQAQEQKIDLELKGINSVVVER